MQLELSELRRGVSVHEAEMNSICTPLNYSSRDAAPERAARGDAGSITVLRTYQGFPWQQV